MPHMAEAAHAPRDVTPQLLREWPLPTPDGSKYSRGQVLVVGGARRSPGAALLAGEAALRVGAGRLTIAVAASVATQVAVALPECGIIALAETADGHIVGGAIRTARDDLRAADTVLVGPGLDDPDQAAALLTLLPGLVSKRAVVVLDAFALGVLRELPEVTRAFEGRLILTPNDTELERLVGRKVRKLSTDLSRLASSFGAVISCQNMIAAADGKLWFTGTGTVGLGTSGSGDILAGAIAGLAARGAAVDQAAVWGTYLHAIAGDSQATKVGPIGFLARELLSEFPVLLDRLRPE
jgi:ADP-dependent NAD(P)H-hydrate dehydratase